MRVCFASFGDDATLVARDCVHASDSLPRAAAVGVVMVVLVWKVLAELAAGPSLRPNPRASGKVARRTCSTVVLLWPAINNENSR